MNALTLAYRFILERRLVMPALLFLINLSCAAERFYSGDMRRGVYWLSSAICIAVVAV